MRLFSLYVFVCWGGILSFFFTRFRDIPTELFETQIKGIPEAIANLTERGAVDPVVKVTVALSESGFAGVQDAVAYGEVKDTSFTGMCALYGFF